MRLVALSDCDAVVALGDEAPAVEGMPSGVVVANRRYRGVGRHPEDLAVADDPLSGHRTGAQRPVAAGLYHEQSQVARSGYPVGIAMACRVGVGVRHPVGPVGNPVHKASRDIPETVAVGVEASRLLSWSHRHVVREVVVTVDVRIYCLVESRDPVVDHQYRDVATRLVDQSPIGVLTKVVGTGKRGVDAGDVVSGLVEQSVGVVVVVGLRSVGVPGPPRGIGIAVNQPVVHAIVVEHQRPAFVRRLRVGHSRLGAIQVGMPEVHPRIRYGHYHTLSCVAPLPGVVGAMYLTAAHRLGLESRRGFERHRVIWFGCLLGVQYGDDTGDSCQLVEDASIHPESPVVDLSVDRVDGNQGLSALGRLLPLYCAVVVLPLIERAQRASNGRHSDLVCAGINSFP